MKDNKEISKLYIDEQMVRLIAAQVALVTILSLVFNSVFPIFLLLADFALRAFTVQPAPLAAVARIIADLLQLKPKPIFAAPKKFAAALGFVCTIVILVFLILHYHTAVYIASGALILFALLESVFRICLGCYVYNWVLSPIRNKRNQKRSRERN